jgi:outer membrane receptor protein involved in Fe transport
MKRSPAFLSCLFVCVFLLPGDDAGGQKKKEKEELLPMITESVTVEAKVPKELPYAATSELKEEKIEGLKPKDLSDLLSYTPGTYVSSGAKSEGDVKLRGLGKNRITLLYDGIPVYEPYFNSFDINSIPSDQVDLIKVVKGASSILYGPNTMGGIVDVLSKRPATNEFTLRLDYGTRKTYGAYASGALRGRNVLFTGFAFREASDGFNWVDQDVTQLRANSDYGRSNLGGKLYYYPGGGAEIMAEVNYYDSAYGVPTATDYYKKQYWRFKDWHRLLANLGGSFPLANGGYVKARLYYTKHYNVLDAYKSSDYSALQWESTYDNYALGAFVLGMVPLGEKHQLNASASYRDDDVSTQSALTAPWEHYEHKILSLGAEDHFRVSEKVKLMAGASLDHLNKQDGENKTTLNPILGVKYNPRDFIDLHLTLSQKSHFPSMKQLYSTPENGGNPDLRDEIGSNLELGFTYDRGWFLSGAVFYDSIRDMIEGRINADFIKQNVNIAKARIAGFEMEARKAFGPVSFSAGYTYLDTENKETGERLDLIPASQLNAEVRFFRPELFSLTLWGVYASDSIYHSGTGVVTVDPYAVVNAAIERAFGSFSLFVKLENILNHGYWTEPGWPMKGRTLTVGTRFFLKGKKD